VESTPNPEPLLTCPPPSVCTATTTQRVARQQSGLFIPRSNRPPRSGRNRQRSPVRHAEVNSRRSVFCSGPLDRRAQVNLCNLLRFDTPPTAIVETRSRPSQVPCYETSFTPEQLSPPTRERVRDFGLRRGYQPYWKETKAGRRSLGIGRFPSARRENASKEAIVMYSPCRGTPPIRERGSCSFWGGSYCCRCP
jgi:hypothetical protein